MQAAIRLLAYREHSRVELQRKLQRKYSPELIEQALDTLAGEGLQSDERYAEQYVEQRIAKGYGPLRIERELHEKGIADELIRIFLHEQPDDWRDLMLRVAHRKYGQTRPEERKEMARQGKFLEYRGFPANLIRDYLFDSDS